MLKTVFVCGTFDNAYGKKSKIAEQIANSISKLPYFKLINGGHITDLIQIFEDIDEYERVFWFPHIPVKTRVKTVEWIKRRNKYCMLITSKRNDGDKYNFEEIVMHGLQLKSNLMLEIKKIDNKFVARILDPLGNCYLDFTDDFALIGKKLDIYSYRLSSVTRVGSQSYGEKKSIPHETKFIGLIRKHSKTIIKLMSKNIKTERFLGNASFRCNKGFPSFRSESGLLYISRRNVEKNTIGMNDFVAVEPALPVFYYGEHKPSIDTPIQIKLYRYYTKAKYILHSHVYVKDAIMTEEFVPCGGLEEADEIIKTIPDENAINFSINLIGHGSLIIADNLKYFESQTFYDRTYPEFIGDSED